jgi:periplasmic divalent cation tolerance protein
MSILVIYTTHPDQDCARRITQSLLDKKLVACGNIFPIDSNYFWNGKMVNEEEWVAIFKTQPNHVEAIEKIFQEEHPYEVPCIVRWSAEANDSYEMWVRKCTEK